jgi:HEXXH motif-containing protein
MSLAGHQIPAALVRAIADGSSGAAGREALVAGQRSKCLALLRLVVDLAAAAGHPEAGVTREGYQALTQVQRLAPQAAEHVLRHPAVGSWALQTVLRLRGGTAAEVAPGRLASVAAAAAIRGDVPCDIGLPRSACEHATLELPSLGRLLLPDWLRGNVTGLRNPGTAGGAAELHGRHGALALPGRLGTDAPGWRAIRAVTAGTAPTRISVLIDDVDSYRLTGYAGQLDQLTADQRRAWSRCFSGGWRVLTEDHPEIAADVAGLIVAMTPLRRPAGAQVSVSSRRAFGGVALSLPDDEVAMAVTLAHEVQHTKLSALMDLFPMVVASARGGYYAPWRDDPRPLASLLQGVYAHLGVASFWRRHRYVVRESAEVLHAHIEFTRWRGACAEVARFLSARPELTPCGSFFVAGMTHLLSSWQHDPVPTAAQAHADLVTGEHRERWIRRHGRADWPAVR